MPALSWGSRSNALNRRILLPGVHLGVTHTLLAQSVTLSDAGRLMGIHVMAGKGSGKSRWMGRCLGFQDFCKGVPLVILDPNGPTINNLLDKVARLPLAQQAALFPRIRYVDMAGSGQHVVPWPLYYRAGGSDESLYRIAQRYPEAIKRIDPDLKTASIQGWNALWLIGTYVGIVLSALGYQITEALSLLNEPEAWQGRLKAALARFPNEMGEAYHFFTEEYPRWSAERKASQTASFRSKIAQLILDPASRAMFGAATPGIDWHEVVEKRLCVLVDFSRETSVELRRFKLLFVLLSFLAFVQGRGAGRHRPISFIIDELAGMYHTGADTFADEMDELINIIARNYSLWLTLAHQELYQFDERTGKTLLNMGTQIIGSTQDPGAAYTLARQFYTYDPYKLKRQRRVWGTVSAPGMGGWPVVIDHEPVEFTSDDQFLMVSETFLNQRPFHFLVKVAAGEGDTTGRLKRMSIERLDHGIWVNESKITQVKAVLREQAGVPVADVMQEIEGRLAGEHPQLVESAPTPQRQVDRIEEYAPPTPQDDLSTGIDYDQL